MPGQASLGVSRGALPVHGAADTLTDADSDRAFQHAVE